MNTFFTKLRLAFGDSQIRNRIFFTLGILVLFRLGSAIPIPGVDTLRLEQFFAGNQFFGLLDIFSGGGLSSLSIFMIGVGAYITASIIMQLMTVIFPRLKEMYQEEGEAGRRKMSQYSRLLTIPLAALQSFSLLILLERQGVLFELTAIERFVNVAVVVAGALLVMWLGELINEYGIGNGISLIIFAGIVSRLPQTVSQLFVTFDVSQVPIYLGATLATVAVIAGIVMVTEAERPIAVTYAKRVRGNRMYGGSGTYLPIRLNTAGVMPIIFALSLLLFPQMIANFMTNAANPIVQNIGTTIVNVLGNQWLYAALYLILVFGFTYFYSSITFEPHSIANNLQKGGAFIPGVRPGRPTAEHLSRTLNRLTLVGASFLGIIAVLPLIMQALTNMSAFAIGGTSLLIAVSVALDFVKQINSQLSMREY